MMSRGDPRSEADKCFAEGTKLITPSVLLLRFKPQWETATPLFERAGLLYRQCGDLAAARAAFEKAAVGQQRQRSGWHAAKNWEKAAEAAKLQGDAQGIEHCCSEAAEQYLAEGRLPAAAEAVTKGARSLEESAPQAAANLYKKALGWLEDSGKDSTHGDTYRMAVAHAVRCGQWQDAVDLELRFAASCEGSGARNSQAKAFLGAVVVWLHAGQAKQAWAVYQDALAVDAFSSSDEAFAAEALFNAYRTGIAANVAAAIKQHPCFLHMDASVARLAKKLHEGAVQAIEAALPGGPGAVDVAVAANGEEDLT